MFVRPLRKAIHTWELESFFFCWEWTKIHTSIWFWEKRWYQPQCSHPTTKPTPLIIFLTPYLKPFSSVTFFLVSIKNTKSRPSSERSLHKDQIAHGLPSPHQFQLRNLCLSVRLRSNVHCFNCVPLRRDFITSMRFHTLTKRPNRFCSFLFHSINWGMVFAIVWATLLTLRLRGKS